MQCMLQDESCRSANFRKTPICGGQENCELLKTVDSEETLRSLKNDENFDYYILLQPERKPEDAFSSSSPPEIAQKISTTKAVTTKADCLTTQATTKSTPKTTEGATIETTTATSTPKKTHSSTTQSTTKSTAKKREGSTTQRIKKSTPKKKEVTTSQPIMNQLTSTPQKTNGLTTQPTITSTPKKTDGSTTQPTITATPKKTDGLTIQPTITSTPQKTNRLTTQPTEVQQLLSSCKELLERNRSLTSGNYTLQNKDSHKKYDVYCHMAEISGCGKGGWTLVMKVNGKKDTFNYSSPYWTNKQTYEVNDGLEVSTQREAKLASYWNTPFSKICLGMEVNGDTKWIWIHHQASSLFNVIAERNFTATNITKSKWKSLIDGSSLQQNCNKQGFNICGGRPNRKMYVRIGLVANNGNDCEMCNSCIGFGTSITGCNGFIRKKACGSIHACGGLQNNIAAFGYILVQ